MHEVHQTDQSTIAAAKIEEPGDRRRQAFEQRSLAFSPVRNRIGLLQVRQRVLRQPPQVRVPGMDVRHCHRVNAIDDPIGTIAAIYEPGPPACRSSSLTLTAVAYTVDAEYSS
jgi:hypothetical protein